MLALGGQGGSGRGHAMPYVDSLFVGSAFAGMRRGGRTGLRVSGEEMRRRKGPKIRVQCYDEEGGKSMSLTVYTSDLRGVAEACEGAVSRRWEATELSDRRHKRG